MTNISDAKILILATDGFEQSELEVPRDQLKKAGATVKVASVDGKSIKGWDGDDWGRSVDVDMALDAANSGDFDAIVLPGGQINPDKLRVEPAAISLIKKFHDDGKVVAAICHGPWLLIEAGLVRDRAVTSFKSIRTDMENAGAHWEDSAVVTDKGMITSRNPNDLDAFCNKIIEEIEEGTHPR